MIGFVALTRFALAAPLALAAACSIVPEDGNSEVPVHYSETRDDPVDARDNVVLRETMLEAHNAARADVLATPISWNADLAADARVYAKQLAEQGRFQHSGQLHAMGQGENLWMGSRKAFTYAEMVGAWVDEQDDYRPGVVPNNSANGKPVGHYTQIIWPTTTQVGCAMAENRTSEYLVCRYTPPGNIVGLDPMGG